MTTAPRLNDTRHEEVPRDLAELTELVAKLPTEYRRSMDPVLLRVIESAKRRRRILSLVQDAISQLRLDMKYLVFDLEATRRERDAYREELDGTNFEDGPSGQL